MSPANPSPPNPSTAPPPTAADLRALIARRRILQYRLAAVVGVSPNRLSSMLNGKIPIPPALAVTIARTVVEAD